MIFITGDNYTCIDLVRDPVHLLLTDLHFQYIVFRTFCFLVLLLSLLLYTLDLYNIWGLPLYEVTISNGLHIGVVIFVKIGIKQKIEAEHIKVVYWIMINCPSIMTLITGRSPLFLILTCYNNARWRTDCKCPFINRPQIRFLKTPILESNNKVSQIVWQP